MSIRTVAGIAFAACAILGCGAAARADQLFCAPVVSFVTAQTPSARYDGTYNIILQMYDSGEFTRAKLAVLEDNREYEVQIPLRGKKQGEDFHGAPVAQFQPVALHFPKPIALQAVWIEQVRDEHGNVSDCLPNAVVPEPAAARLWPAGSEDPRQRASRKNAIAVNVPLQDGIPFITPQNCPVAFTDATATLPVAPEIPEAAKRAIHDKVTAMVRVNVKPDGEIAAVSMEKSSDYPFVDQATLSAALRSKFTPKKVECIPFAGMYLFYATFFPNA